MRRNLKRLGLTMALVGILSAWAAPAWAPKHLFTGPPTIAGTCFDDEAVDFSGTFEARSFSVADGTLMVTGVATGTCEGGEVKEEPVSEEATGPAGVTQAVCDDTLQTFVVSVRSAESRSLSLGESNSVLHLLYDAESEKPSFRHDICKSVDLFDSGQLGKLAKLLNKIVVRDYEKPGPAL